MPPDFVSWRAVTQTPGKDKEGNGGKREGEEGRGRRYEWKRQGREGMRERK